MAGTTKKDTRRPTARNAGDSSARGDRYKAENVGAGAVIVQGKYNKVINYVFGNTPPSVEEEGELKRLKEVVSQKVAELKSAVEPKKPSGGNPYHLLEALNIHERDQLSGRDGALNELTARLESKRFAALSGENGIGKTSLLRAGLIPGLVNAGHWPIRIEVGGEAAEATIKKAVFGSLEGFARLAAHPLRDVLHLASAFVPQEKDIVLLVDNLDELFKQPAEAQAEFVKLWKECVNDPGLNARWLFCVSGVTHHLSQFQSGELNPFANLTLLGPLDRGAAKQAIVEPARVSEIKIEKALVETLVKDLGGDEVEPARLQIVCHTLASGKREIALADYEQAGRVDGLLQAYLDRAIREIPLESRDPAWQVLSLLEEEGKPVAAREIERQLSSFGVRDANIESLLETLEVKHLVIPEEAGYRLASESWRKPIRDWRKQEAIPRQIQKETARLVEQIRNSALRGLVGGAVGLAIFRSIVGVPPINLATGAIDPLQAAILALLYAPIGGLTGMLLTFSVDISSAIKMSMRTRYLVGGLVGAITFGPALALFGYLSITGENLLQAYLFAALEGCLWGLVAGIGITWGMLTARPAWLFLLIVPIASGVTLLLANSLLAAFVRPLPLEIAAGGWVFPLLIAIGARLGRRTGGVS